MSVKTSKKRPGKVRRDFWLTDGPGGEEERFQRCIARQGLRPGGRDATAMFRVMLRLTELALGIAVPEPEPLTAPSSAPRPPKPSLRSKFDE